jgi:ribosome-associated protein
LFTFDYDLILLGLNQRFPKSKSQVKRELQALHDLGRNLVELPGKSLQQIPLADETREAIIQAKHLKMEALRRQLKHIGKLMRDEDADSIRIALDKLRHPHEKEVSEFHEVEGWRDSLLAGDDAVLGELCVRFVDIDRQHLRQLIRNAKKERELNKPPKSARVLFRYLKGLSDNNDGS